MEYIGNKEYWDDKFASRGDTPLRGAANISDKTHAKRKNGWKFEVSPTLSHFMDY